MGNQISEVRLLNVPLESDYKHTLYFANKASQESYFLGKSDSFNTFTELSYQRKEKYISIPRNYESLKTFNYLMYRNLQGHYDDWYYAFITKMEYKSDSVTWVYFEVDVLQTYLTKYTVKPSFIEREHTDDDTIGKHTFPENLEIGEYVCEHRDMVSELVDCSYVMGVTDHVADADGWAPVVGGKYDGIFSGIKYWGFKSNEVNDLTAMVTQFAKAGKNDSIKSIFMYPESLLDYKEDANGDSYIILGSENVKTISKTFTRNLSYKGIQIKNAKLFTYPFQYLLVANNNGGSAIYHFEEFADLACEFTVMASLTPGGSIRMIPKNYKGLESNIEEGLNLGKYPICNWTSDEYTNWLTQNSVNIGLNLLSGVGQIAGGAAVSVAGGAMVGVGAIGGGVSTIANQLAQVHQMSFISSQSRGNINCGDVITAGGTNTFHFFQMRIKEEYLYIIDNFFSMFGYKCNRVKVPLSNHRENYWYTKTIDVSIDGNIPGEDMQKIKDCYNRGVTFWKNPDNIGNYSVSNSTV